MNTWTLTGARVWEVSGTGLPFSMMGASVFFLRCTMSSAAGVGGGRGEQGGEQQQ